MFNRKKIRKKESIANSKAFCMKPWVHLFVSQKGTVGPCCLASWEPEDTFGDVNKTPIDDIWNGPGIRKFRKNMLADKPDSRCWQCYDNEKNGLRSTRRVVNFLYADHFDRITATKRDGTSSAPPIFWDIRISNLCNLRCRICGHHSSSSWYDDAKATDSLSYESKIHRGPKDFTGLMDQLDTAIDGLEEVYFAGGEPLIMPEHFELLSELVKRKKFDVKIRYSTNFSNVKFKEHDLLEIWKQFDDVFIHASLDGAEANGMLQRKGLDWDLAVRNRQRMLEVCPKVDFMLTPTINIHNIFHLPELHKKCVTDGLIQVDEFIPHVLKNPAYYSISILPQQQKQAVEVLLKEHIEWILAYAEQHPPEAPTEEQIAKLGGNLHILNVRHITGHVKLDIQLNELQNCITYMHSRDDSHLIPEFVAHTNKLDELRQEDTRQVIPELAPLWDFI